MQDLTSQWQSESWQKVVQRVAAVSPLVAFAAVALYAVGFVVVTAYLASYGVRELEPLRPRYVAAAVPFLAAIIGTWIWATRADGANERIWQIRAPWFVRAVLGILLYLFVAAVAALLVTFLLQYLNGFQASTLDDYGRVLRFCSCVVILYWLVKTPERNEPLAAVRDPLYIGIIAVGAVLSYVSIYAMLPTWVGGGKPDLVQLTLASPVPKCAECADAEVRLIDADAHRFVLLVGSGRDERAIEVARSHVIAISHVPTTRP
jgi:succinate dehydrogenase/fumarate reductase cytochrome b subunit